MRDGVPIKFPNQLWKHRKIMGLTQVDVAKRLGINNRSMISRWERGVTIPSVENLLKLSVLYKTLANELYCELIREYQLKLFPE